MLINFQNITITTFKLILKDKFIITPYLIFFLLFSLIEHYFKLQNTGTINQLVIALSVGWLAEILFKAVTINMANMLREKERIHIKESIIFTLKRLHHLLFGMVLLFLPLLYFFVTFANFKIQPKLTLLSGVDIVWWLMMFVLVIILSLILEFIPIFVLCEKENGLKSIMHSVFFIKKNFTNVLIFSSLSVCVTMLFLLVSNFFGGIPVLGDAFLRSLFQSIGNAFIQTFLVIFYFKVKQARQISVKV